MKITLEMLLKGSILNTEEAYQLFSKLTNNEFSEAEIASLLTVFRMRAVTVNEFRGFRKAFLEKCISVDLSNFDTINVIGTGGDGKNTFNISTTSSFVIAGAGYKVAKYGNYGKESVSGASNIFEYYKYKFTNKEGELRKNLEKTGICFLHAPLFHPAMELVSNVRKCLKVRTIFNYLEPIINPANPQKQLIGCNNFEVMKLYNGLLRNENCKYVMVHSVDGYDEISLTSNAIIGTDRQLEIVEPNVFGLGLVEQKQLIGGKTTQEAAKIFLNILKNEGTEAQKKVVIANAAMAISCFKPNQPLADSIQEARESIDSMKALNVFKQLINS